MQNDTFSNQSLLLEQVNDSALDVFLSKNIIYFETSLYILYSLIFLFGVLGNTIVIYVLVTSLCVNRHIQIINNELTTIQKSNNAVKGQSSSAHLFNNSFKSLTKKRNFDENFSPKRHVKENLNRKKHDNLAVNFNLNNDQIEYECKNFWNILFISERL